MTERPIRVLLVDDDEDDYVMTRELLSEAGTGAFQLDWVFDYEKAIEAIERREHAVYLLDYRLGERSGLDILRRAGGNRHRRLRARRKKKHQAAKRSRK